MRTNILLGVCLAVMFPSVSLAQSAVKAPVPIGSDAQDRIDGETSGPHFDEENPGLPSHIFVRYQADISKTGRASNCTIIESSGKGWIDKSTCNIIRNSQRFDPALDASAQPAEGSYSGVVSWSARKSHPNFDKFELMKKTRVPTIKAAPGWVYTGEGWGNFYYSVDVDSSGKPSNCAPLLPTFANYADGVSAADAERAYHASLDVRNRAMCDLVMKQSFSPERDHDGNAVASHYVSNIAMTAELWTKREWDDWNAKLKKIQN